MLKPIPFLLFLLLMSQPRPLTSRKIPSLISKMKKTTSSNRRSSVLIMLKREKISLVIQRQHQDLQASL